MFLIQKPLFFWVETPLHAGSGSDLGIVDLPIQREKHTNFPKIEGSGIKGCLRESFKKKEIPKNEQDKHRKKISLSFGPEDTNDAHAGALGFSDARLLLFPVKSVKGVFAWITCPQVIRRFKNDLQLCGINNGFNIPGGNTVPEKCDLTVKENKIVLEEYTFTVTKDNNKGNTTKLGAWLKKNITNGFDSSVTEKISTDTVILSDEDFKDFVTMSTEVIARTKIEDSTGTVARGALWYEEYLPVDSILYSLIFSGPVYKEEEADKDDFKVDESDEYDKKQLSKGISKTNIEAQKVMNFFKDNLPKILQIGGNASIGKGFVRTVLLDEAKQEDAKNDN